jgi:hypothetical protein
MVILYTAKSYGKLDLDPDLVVEYVARTEPDATATLAEPVGNAVAIRPQTAYPVPGTRRSGSTLSSGTRPTTRRRRPRSTGSSPSSPRRSTSSGAASDSSTNHTF